MRRRRRLATHGATRHRAPPHTARRRRRRPTTAAAAITVATSNAPPPTPTPTHPHPHLPTPAPLREQVTDYVARGSLFHLLHRARGLGPPSTWLALRFLSQCARGMHYLHSRQVSAP